MTSYIDLPFGPAAPRRVTMVVEIPKNSSLKTEYDEKARVFRVSRALASPVYYPVEYGFIPRTRGGDGDALDVMALATHPSFTGAVMEVRVIGGLKVRDEGERDLKVLAVPAGDPRYVELRDLDDLPAHFRPEIEHFYGIYTALEGQDKRVEGWSGAKAAQRAVLDAHVRFGRRARSA